MSNLQSPQNLTGLSWKVNWEGILLKRRVQLINNKAGNVFNYVGLENVESWTGKLIKSIGELAEEEAATANRFYAGNVLIWKTKTLSS